MILFLCEEKGHVLPKLASPSRRVRFRRRRACFVVQSHIRQLTGGRREAHGAAASKAAEARSTVLSPSGRPTI